MATAIQSKTTLENLLMASSGGLTLGFFLLEVSQMARVKAAAGTEVNTWLQISTDESITLTIGAAERGPATFSELVRVAAENLSVEVSRIATVADGPTLFSPVPFRKGFRAEHRVKGWKMKDAAAAAREMLVQSAMDQTGDDCRDHYLVRDGAILCLPRKTALSYGQVAAAASMLPPPAGASLIPNGPFRRTSITAPRLEMRRHQERSQFRLDSRVPSMA